MFVTRNSFKVYQPIASLTLRQAGVSPATPPPWSCFAVTGGLQCYPIMFRHDPVVEGVTVHQMHVTPFERYFLQCIRCGDGKRLSDSINAATELAMAVGGLSPEWEEHRKNLELASFLLDDLADDTYRLREHYRYLLPDPDRCAMDQYEAPFLTSREKDGADGIPAMGR
jgi:hypothetical protein